MTYLQLVNSVLRRLREDEVTTVAQTSYSKLIGEFVNAADTFNYVLTGSQNRMKLLDVVNDTSDWFMQYRGSRWMDNAFLIETPPIGAPQFYSFNGVDAAGDNAVDIYPKPDGVYQLRFNVVLRTADFTEDTDKLGAPSSPVIQLATALGARERGETGGTSAAELFALADNTLADAIAIDASQHPEERA
jgi:hypothetical protein